MQQNTASIIADIRCYTYQIHILISRNRFKLVKSHIRVRKSLCDQRISTKSTHNANAYEYIPSHPVHSCLGYDEISDTIQVHERISQELIHCARIRKQIAEDLANLYSVLEFGFGSCKICSVLSLFLAPPTGGNTRQRRLPLPVAVGGVTSKKRTKASNY